jgi:hypothetical protein
MRSILAWLDAPAPLNAVDEVEPLLVHLATLRANPVTPQQRASTLGRLFARSVSVVASLLPSLIGVSLPAPRKTRQLVRSLQDLLRLLAEDLLSPPDDPSGQRPPVASPEQQLALWRSLYALAQHLLISDLTASPAGAGIWRQLHQTYEAARRLGVTGNTPEGAASSLENVYYSAVLLGCAQPASFTALEVDFVATYLHHFAHLIDANADTTAETPAAFWIDPAQDAAAVACSRKPAPPETHVRYFSCERIVALLKKQLLALKAGGLPQQIDLPEFAGTPAGRGVLRRLIAYWGEPGKRRFSRRRQNYRAVLCAGLNSLWSLFQDGGAATIETSSWMIINESPDGYALMHVSGKTGGLCVGDVTAIRIESGEGWQIAIVRWALSENQEHLEIGLQLLATGAVPAYLALPAEPGERSRRSVLILPKIKPLRSSDLLVVPSGALENQSGNLVLVVEKENVSVREVRSTQLDEQNGFIEVFSIDSDSASD